MRKITDGMLLGLVFAGWSLMTYAGVPSDRPPLQDRQRTIIDLSGDWQVSAIRGINFTYPPKADAPWSAVNIPELPETTIKKQNPYCPNVSSLMTKDGSGLANTEGIAYWYRRTFTAPEIPKDCGRVLLRINGATFRSDTWLNGKKLGTSLNGMLPFDYDVTSVIKSGPNEILIGLAGREGLLDVANKTFLSPSSGVGAGLWGNVYVIYLPKSYIDDVFVKTSVKEKKIALETVIVNTEAKSRTCVLSANICESQSGRVLTSVGPVTVELPANASKTVELAKDWIAPSLWSPENPALLRAEVRIDADGKTLDERQLRFGFREFEIRGRDFYLNGVKTVLFRNSWLTAIPSSRFQIFEQAKSTATHTYNCFRFHIGFNCEAAFDVCDELGIMVMPESAWHNFDGKFSMDKVDLWLPGVVSYTKELIKRHRNHPSVIVWNLTNESIWGNTDDPRMKIADALVAAAKEADGTRPCEGDGEVNWGGRLPIINIHYPESTVANSLREKYPNSGTVFPNDCHWLSKDGMNGSWRAGFKWDRPLIIGEYWYPSGDPDRAASFMGESVYDWEKWSSQSMSGNDGRTDSEFYRATQMITDAYRMDGAAGMNPWACGNEKLMLAVNVRPVDFFPNLASGRISVRKFVVFNDTQKDIPRAQLQCRLTSEGRVLWEKIIDAHVAPGNSKVFDVPIECPETKVIKPATLSIQLRQDTGGWHQRASHEEQVFIVPKTSLSDLISANIAVLDSKGGTVAALEAIGLKARRLQALTNADLADVKVLIVGDNTDPSAYKDAIASFVKSGGVVVVLRQDTAIRMSTDLPETDPAHITTRSWMRNYDHQILNGLDDGQFSYWRPDHIVAMNSYNKPSNGPARALVDAGGLYGLRWSPLVEVSSGKGRYLLSQFCLVEKLGVEPMAGAMLERIIRYAVGAGSAKSQLPPMRILAGDNTDAMIAMSEAGVETAKGLAGEGPIFVDASHKLSAEEIETIRKHLVEGGNVWLHGFSSKNIANVASLFPFKPEMEPVDQKIHIAVRRSDDPMMSNLSSFDFCWTRMDLETRWNFFEASHPTAKLGTESLRIPSLDKGIALTEPKLLVKVPAGKGTILFDSLAWDKAIGAESERVARITASLSANLGANVRLIRDETSFDCFNVDFAPYANMGFYDKVADDGIGGWTDQGENDMRFFLINHTGKGGGREDGMEVEAENFPALVNFLDRPFRIPDPKKNNGKSVISLRGETHGVKLPSKIEGVKVGKKADRLWMIHAAGWTPEKPDMEVARYVINYTDGSKATVPVRFNIEVSDWWNPKPLSNAKVAWTGRNLVQSPIGFYMMEWRNPSPGKEIASIDVIGDIAPTQFVCLGITGGVVRGGTDASGPVASWNLSEISGGAVRNQIADAGVLKVGERAPLPAVVDNIPGLRFKDGASLNADEKTCASLFNGSPFAIRVKVCIESPPPGYMGGIFQRMRYGESGFRLVVYKDLKVGAEIYVGGKQTNITSSVPLHPGKWYDVELRFDGKYAVLSLDGKISSMLETAPPAPCVSMITIGNASGKDYFLNGVVGTVELRNVPKEK